jgi:hypothetical protein
VQQLSRAKFFFRNKELARSRDQKTVSSWHRWLSRSGTGEKPKALGGVMLTTRTQSLGGSHGLTCELRSQAGMAM